MDKMYTSTHKPKLLIVDDEAILRDTIQDVLEAQFEMLHASNGKEAIEISKKHQPDVIIMDVMMPVMSGVDACKILRTESSTRDIPILMITGVNTVEKRIELFDLGVDDFISKPFHNEELKSRIFSKYLKSQKQKKLLAPEYRCSNLVLNIDTVEAKIGHATVILSPVEFEIVKLLIINEGKIVSREVILKEVWKGKAPNDRVIDAHIVSLRKKLAGFKGEFRTVYGNGYLIRA